MIIGIAARRKLIDDKPNIALSERYLRAGHSYVLLLPDQDNTKLLSLCDCFIIPGGWDINPDYYNEPNSGSLHIDLAIDELDFSIVDYAIKNNKALLGICRGLQVINVYFGGTLFQDIEDHMDKSHLIYKVGDSTLAMPECLMVSSFHHQAIDKLGVGLKTLYASQDGYIEVIRHAKYKVIATQYHPEIDRNSNTEILWEALRELVERDTH